MRPTLFFSGIAALSLTFSASAFAYQAPAAPTAAISPAPEFAKFTPKPDNEVKVDYKVLDEILNNIVFLTGLSTRQIAPKPEAITGGRFVWEHTSPYRQEGNKIPFSKLKTDHVATLQEYKRDLENVSASVDIASLPKKEQLAYWLNLHNVTVITLIAENYPVVQPGKMLIGPEKAPMHDAKVISVDGTMMSLRDIRENVVYPNWQDPKVIYGFFMGDIGSPSVQGQAFTADNTEKLLNANANEFINSLRSFSRGRVSKIYKDAERFYFPNFDKDWREHAELYMWDDVKAELAKTKSLKVGDYEYDIADMEGGYGGRVIGNVSIDGKPVKDSQSYNIASYTNQIKDKTRTLKAQGKIKSGVVTVGDGDESGETKPGAEE
jgi:hypothetical protein